MSGTHSLLERQLRKHFGSGWVPPDGFEAFVQAVDRAYREFDADRLLVENSLQLSSQELFAANSEIRAVLRALPDLVLRLDYDGVILTFSAGESSDPLMRPSDLLGRRVQDTMTPEDGAKFFGALRRAAEDRVIVSLEYTLESAGQPAFYEARLVPLLDDQIVAIIRNITERKRAEKELANVHRALIDASREAGMAEVATGVLHNVGNVLNSVNVSANLLAESQRKSKVSSLGKVVALLREHRADLGTFLVDDPRGRQLPDYLAQLTAQLAGERADAESELRALRSNIDHIKEVVSMQQSYAKVSGVSETINLVDLVEDALRINASSLDKHEIRVVREYTAVPALSLDKHKILQILVNLIRNAKIACDETGRNDKQLRLHVERAVESVQVTVTDNGVGIPPENLTRIFQHGFTTRKNGHGFGLHSGALAAKEMGGALLVASLGVGRGASFALKLPCRLVAKSPIQPPAINQPEEVGEPCPP